MAKSCVICGEEESGEVRLLELPCWRHHVCTDDVGDFFERATEDESCHPPQCCGQIMILEDFVEHVSDDIQLAYRTKDEGEYSIMPKYRVYCGNSDCGQFIHPGMHIKDVDSNLVYAVCEAVDCGMVTCVPCKTLIRSGLRHHECKGQEVERVFQETAKKEGYKECFACGRTIELAEACNHITCQCGSSFCYICGKQWEGIHGCPQYGPAQYDDEGYNQDGYHRDTGLNRDGRSRVQQLQHERGEAGEDSDEDDDPDANEDVLQHVNADRRAFINSLDPETREEALDLLRIELMETQGIFFGQPQHNGNNQQFGEDDEESEENENDDEDDEGDEARSDAGGDDEDGEGSTDDGNSQNSDDSAPEPQMDSEHVPGAL